MLAAAAGPLDLLQDGSWARVTFDATQEKHVKGMKDLIFFALHKIDGDMTALEQFRANMELVKGDRKMAAGHVFPHRDELGYFLGFVRAISRSSNSAGPLMSDQYAKSIPCGLKKVNRYMAFWRDANLHLDSFVDRELLPLLSRFGPKQRRKEVVNLFVKFMQRCGETDREDSYRFVAGQVVAEIEEVFNDPFGDITFESINQAYGSQEAMFCVTDEAGKEYVERESLGSERTKDKIKTLFDECLRAYHCLSDDALHILHLERHEGRIRIRLNQRWLCYKDVEHFLCKGYIVCNKTHAGRAMSFHPRHSEPHCHPIRWLNENGTPMWGPCLHHWCQRLCSDAQKAFRKVLPKMPACGKFNGEQDGKGDEHVHIEEKIRNWQQHAIEDRRSKTVGGSTRAKRRRMDPATTGTDKPAKRSRVPARNIGLTVCEDHAATSARISPSVRNHLD
jgi:hypothetical protein